MLRITLSILFSTVLTATVFAQDTTAIRKFPFSDTTLIAVDLPDTLNAERLMMVINNNNAIIYIREDSISVIADRGLSDAYLKKDCKEIVAELNKARLKKSTDLSRFYSYYLKHIIAAALMNGTASVYDKQNKLYLKTVFHRMERVISTGYRKFYFSPTDRRYLFSRTEMIGILPNEFMDIE
ncbi:hypothetical protein [Ferruginibacter sp. SUN106]|uniref:hypothetical protein n=1 Tax=Ferruginibacter sp. SUN106 TaxID=2978348 RepID=UPI003D36621E